MKTSEKHFCWALGLVTWAKMAKNLSYLWHHSHKNPKPKTKYFFQSSLEDLPHPLRVSTALYHNQLASYGVAKWCKNSALCGISRSNIFVHWQRTSQPFNDRAHQDIGAPFFGHKSPAAIARELFKPSTDSASLLVDIKKKSFLLWVWGFLGGTSQVGVFLCYFGHLCLALGAVPMGHFLDSKFSWKLSQNLHL